MEMEDPGDWEIQEYSSSHGGGNSKMSWLMEKGLNLGRKIVITGVVISSAPLVLPPLVVISVLGFAFSVPLGIVFASYACTEKLMSTLLPTPKSPIMLENGTLSEDEMREELGFEGDIMEEEEKDQVREMKEWNEVRTEGVEYRQEGDENDEEQVEEVDQSVKEEGYVEVVVVDCLERENDGKLEGIGVEIEGMGEYKEEEPVRERSKGEQPLDEVQQFAVSGERDKGREEKSMTDGKEMEKSSEVERVKSEKLIGEMRGTEAERRNRRSKQNEEIHGRTEDNVVERAVGMRGTNGDEKKLENVLIVEETIVEERRPVANKKAVLQTAVSETQIVSVGHEGSELEWEKEHLIYSNGPGDKYSDTSYENPKDRTAEGSAAFLELQVSGEVPELKHAAIHSEIDTVMPATKVPLSEEKIQEQMNALRTIVGYKAAPRELLIEELKALYIFTGVEPPTSFANASDLAEVNDKLRFLMSIVGVK